MRPHRVDHFALEVDRFDERVDKLVKLGMLKVIRRSHRYSTGQRIALLGDGSGFKIELIEGDVAVPSFAHLAFGVADVDGLHNRMLRDGWRSKRAPHDLPAALARTALLTDGVGFDVQVITYEDGSPDIATWTWH